jgi:hypothetical protein
MAPAKQLHLPAFITQHLTLWFLGIVGALVWGGAMAYMDTRHVQREEFMQSIYVSSEVRLLDKIDDATAEVERLELYNRLGSQSNQPARDQVIIQTTNRMKKWEGELERLQQQRPE